MLRAITCRTDESHRIREEPQQIVPHAPNELQGTVFGDVEWGPCCGARALSDEAKLWVGQLQHLTVPWIQHRSAASHQHDLQGGACGEVGPTWRI